MTDAAIVGVARTPIGKAARGSLNMTHGATMAGHAIAAAIARSGVDPGEIDDVLLGCAWPEGATGNNIARMSAVRAGLPLSVGGATINRFCSSGLQAIVMAAHRVMCDGVSALVAGGVESVSLVAEHLNTAHDDEAWLRAHHPALWMPMIDTAEIVARRYAIDRATQDAYALESQRRMAAAQAEMAISLPDFLEMLDPDIHRVRGTAVFMTGNSEGVPSALLHNLKHNQVLHQRVFLLTVVTAETPYVDPAQRTEYQELGKDFYRLIVHFGFMEQPDIPEALAVITTLSLPLFKSSLCQSGRS